MATNIYRINQGLSKNGRDLVECLDRIGTEFARLKRLFAAMTQERDNGNDEDASFATPAAVFRFVDENGAVSSSVARSAYAELNSFVGNGAAALEQCCARFKQ